MDQGWLERWERRRGVHISLRRGTRGLRREELRDELGATGSRGGLGLGWSVTKIVIGEACHKTGATGVGGVKRVEEEGKRPSWDGGAGGCAGRCGDLTAGAQSDDFGSSRTGEAATYQQESKNAYAVVVFSSPMLSTT